MSPQDLVTGAFGYTGKYIAARLLASGRSVRTLTGHPNRPDPFGGRVELAAYNFSDRRALTDSLRGIDTLYNTYWVRFDRAFTGFEQAVDNTRALIAAALEAGIRRFVHLSVTNPALAPGLPYFRGKALLEEALASSGLSYAIIRPTLIYGGEDVLVNNIAWMLRRFPLFLVPGRGDYRLQPVFVEDLAALAVRLGQEDDNVVVDAAGPDIMTFLEMVHLIASAVGSRSRVARVPPALALCCSRIIGHLVGDVVLTRDELSGLMEGLLVSADPPTCTTRLADWLQLHRDTAGTVYASELARHFRPS